MEDQARVPGHHHHHHRPTSSLLPRLKPRCPSNSFVSGCLAFQRTMGRLKDQSLNLAEVKQNIPSQIEVVLKSYKWGDLGDWMLCKMLFIFRSWRRPGSRWR